jgi:hypothetical protein
MSFSPILPHGVGALLPSEGCSVEGTLSVNSKYPITTQAQQNGSISPLGTCAQESSRPNGPAAIVPALRAACVASMCS